MGYTVEDDKQTRISQGVPDPFVGRTIDGYRVDELIGRGGMGEVYRATQLSLRRPVAIKVLPDSLAGDKRFLDRFEREVDILSRLSHPAIVTVFERGEVDGRPYLAMEYVEGTSLRAVLKQGPLPPTEALVIVRAVLGALEHAHKKGIIHRDIKPENILLAPGGVVKVADFGLSRLVHGEEMTRLTQSLVALGTYEYMAPEQREQSKDCDERTDLYATGVVLYETIAGELPIGHFDPLSKKRPEECDSRIDSLVERSLKKSPEERFGTATDMGDAVSQLISKPGVMPAVVPAVPVPDPVGQSILESMPPAPAAEAPRADLSDEASAKSDQALAQAEAARMEHHLDNLAVIDRVFAVLLGLAGAAWVGLGLADPINPDAAVLFWTLGGLWFVGAFLCWHAASLLKARRFGAQGLQAFLGTVAGLTVVLLPVCFYSFWVLWGHRGRRYYLARASGKSPVEAALQVVLLFGSGVHEFRRRRERKARPLVSAVMVAGGLLVVVAAIATQSWLPVLFGLAVTVGMMLLPILFGLLVPVLVVGVVLGSIYLFVGVGDRIEPPSATIVPDGPTRTVYRHGIARLKGFPPPAGHFEAVLRSEDVADWVKKVAGAPTYPAGLEVQVRGTEVRLAFHGHTWGAHDVAARERVAAAVAYVLEQRAGHYVESTRPGEITAGMLEKNPFPHGAGK